jgi:hypothetical protein
VSIANDIRRIRTLFKYAYDMGRTARPVKFGPEFRKPSKKAIRKRRKQKGQSSFTAVEICTLLASAPVVMRAMVWVGINCGLGQSDISHLTRDAIYSERSFVSQMRKVRRNPQKLTPARLMRCQQEAGSARLIKTMKRQPNGIGVLV